MRPFDSVAALVENAFNANREPRIKNAADTCLSEVNYRGTVKTSDYDNYDEWRYLEYRLIREAINLETSWSSAFSYSMTLKSADKNDSITLSAVSGQLPHAAIGRVVTVNIETAQKIPETVWQHASHRLGDLIQIPGQFKEFGDIKLDEVERMVIKNRTRITGQFDLHMPEGASLAHESRPKPPCLLAYKAEQSQRIHANLNSIFRSR